MEKKFVKKFMLFSTVLLILLGGMVIIVDPFYHYHAPVGSLKAVVSKGEYQCVGTVENFEYDSILLGSSVAENYNNRWFDEAFGGTTIKGIQRSATTVDLLYYLEKAIASNELKNVYYNLDPSALNADANKVYPDSSMPLYLHNDNPMDDVQYIWNKDVIFEHIPYMLAMSFVGDYDEGTSYNWAQYKTFSEAGALSNYNRPQTIVPMIGPEVYKANADANIAAIEEFIKNNPQITFRFIIPPYSILWWDNTYRNGETEQNLYAIEAAAQCFLQYENVEMYYYQNNEEIITDLNNYMDTIHFSDKINYAIVEWMKEGKGRLTLDNFRQEIVKMHDLAEIIQEKYIPMYYN